MPVKPKTKSATDSYNQGNKSKNLHAAGSYGYAKGTSAVGPGKSKPKSTSVNKTPTVEQRMQQFKNDPKAQNAVRQMTTPQGYSPDPLKSRGGSTGGAKVVVKKGPKESPVKRLKVKPKF